MKKGLKYTMAAAAGAGAAMLLSKKTKENEHKQKEISKKREDERKNYRNTERGKYEKNSKGIYYSNGNYEAFARPEKPEGVDGKNAYIVGSGLASLAAACFLVRDGQMKGSHIHILEAMDIAGGACDGIFDPSRGYVMRGGREMENHFECLWDLFRSIPSIETPGVSVLDEYYWLNKKDPNYSLCRATVNRGEDAHTDGKFNLSQKGCMEIMKLFMTKDEDLYDKTIEDVFDDEVFDSTFWLYWRTMFAFENWHSALEMKLYFQRFIHHIAGLPDFSALKFTKYNQYESLILPMQKYLEEAVANGKAVLANEDADQETVSAAATAILNELSKAVKNADLSSLESLIKSAKKLQDGNYTSNSLAKLDEVIKAAEAVVANKNRTAEEVNKAYSDLIDAVISLEKKGNKAALKAMLEKAAAVLEDSDAYVAATIEGLADVKADAQAVYDNDDAVQNEVNVAVRTLTLKLAEARLLGDVDNDGAVTTADSTALLAASAELTELDADAAAAADVNGDGVADTGDAALILEYAAEKVAGF